MVSHKYALERAQKAAPTRADERSQKRLSVTKQFKKLKSEGPGFEPRKIITFLVISTFRCFARTPPAAEQKGSQLTDYRAIEKGVEKIEPITTELN